jgi:S-adenosylmethionine hydrolase
MSRADRSSTAIAILSDFGYRDHYVGVMKGVIESIAPGARSLDLTHGIPPQQVNAGALVLAQSWRYFPQRTVFLAVVDPGVGTDRLPIAIATHAGAFFVGPDNGLLWTAAAAAQIKQIVELKTARYRLPNPSSTFHGRDIFAPAAAWISRGVRLSSLGPPREQIVKLEVTTEARETSRAIEGKVIYIDRFGNLVTNISRGQIDRLAARDPRFAERLTQGRLEIRLGRRPAFRIGRAYGEVAPGRPLGLFGSFEMVEIAVRDGDAAAYFGAGAGSRVTITAGK